MHSDSDNIEQTCENDEMLGIANPIGEVGDLLIENVGGIDTFDFRGI